MSKKDDTALDPQAYHTHFTKPQAQLWGMILFLILIGLVIAILMPMISTAFWANPVLNGLICAALGIGIIISFLRVLELYPEIRWVNSLRIADPGLAIPHQPRLLAPMANMLRDRRGVLSLSTASMSSIIDSVGTRLDERRDTSRYLVNLLIFLGLLGTFFGLLETIQSVGQTINSLDVSSADSVNVFQELKQGLEAPLKGMGTAFSASLFGLSGSLILGFLDLLSTQSQNRFHNDLEEWLSGITELTPGTAGDSVAAQLRYAIVDMQRSMADIGSKLAAAGGGNGQDHSEAVKELASGIEKLVRQMRAEQKVVREWVDEQAAQQNELQNVLRDLSSTLQNRR